MIAALLVAFVSVTLGAWLALGVRTDARVMRPIRVVAMLAAVVVIATHLLPEALHELGPKALIAFVLGVLLPALVERLGSLAAHRAQGRHEHGSQAAALEITYAGLVAHRFGDGLTLGGVTRTGGPFWATAGVLLALAAHIVPVTTVMILAVLEVKGRASAVVRSGVLAVSTMTGVVVASVAVEDGPASLGPWISASVAGLLLHIVAHDVQRKSKSGPAHPENAIPASDPGRFVPSPPRE
jgi:hypothetical protein